MVFANPDKSLPGTEKEAAILDERAPDWNLQSEIYLREEATEEKFISVVSPYILHVTTHGYFENPEKINFLPRSGSKLQSNPMHENLLVFAPQEKEPSPSYENDGILTAASSWPLPLGPRRCCLNSKVVVASANASSKLDDPSTMLSVLPSSESHQITVYLVIVTKPYRLPQGLQVCAPPVG